jgi:hypothetical protein
MPAQAGIQKALRFLGSRLRGNDEQMVIQGSHDTFKWFIN